MKTKVIFQDSSWGRDGACLLLTEDQFRLLKWLSDEDWQEI